MSESQSRYSIVERLKSKKLKIMTDMSDLENTLSNKFEKHIKLVKDLKNWESDIKEDLKRERRNKQRAIEDSLKDAQNFEDSIKKKLETFQKQIDSLDDALKSIEHISETSPTVNK